MATNIIVHLTPIKPGTTLASARIAMFLRKTLSIPTIIDCREYAEELLGQVITDKIEIDVIYLVNGPPAFCQFRDTLAELVRDCRTVVWINNDFTIYPPSQVNKIMRLRGWVNEKGHVDPPHKWTTIPTKITKSADSYVNWNALTFHNYEFSLSDRMDRLFYFGAYRDGREDSFKKYLSPLSKLVISASSRAQKKFAATVPDAVLVGPVDNVILTCSAYKYGLYIHDHSSSRKFMSLANRFYEMLSAGMLIFVAEDARSTFELAGYNLPEEFVVYDGKDLKNKMNEYTTGKKRYSTAVGRQQKLWRHTALRERRALTRTVHTLEGKLS